MPHRGTSDKENQEDFQLFDQEYTFEMLYFQTGQISAFSDRRSHMPIGRNPFSVDEPTGGFPGVGGNANPGL
jgi:hypothetical protein